MIHNDSDLIKRAIRDIYNRDIEEVVIEGDEGYRAAKDFMKLLMPSHARKVKQYADPVSLFQRHGVEDQLAAMYHPVVQLKSGGYLVINPTEALVSIDINSGRSTREHNIEQTALNTNLEAAREIARQLRLRDMAGLVVIDFIDMEHGSNVRKVEKAMKDALKDDRARIQVGRISGFGLMEMSRQRLRTGVLEASTRACPHCEGTGLVRTASSAGLSALRMLEEEAARGRGTIITLRASQEAAFYVLNNKRRELDEIEHRYGVTIVILPDGEVEGARMSVEASGPKPSVMISYAPILEEDDADLPLDEVEDEEESAAEGDERAEEREDGGRRRRRRRRRRSGRRQEGETQAEADARQALEDDAADAAEEAADTTGEDAEPEGETASAPDDEAGEVRRRSRRGRRGGRRRRGEGGDAALVNVVADEEQPALITEAPQEGVTDPAPEPEVETQAEEEMPKPKARRPRARKPKAEEAVPTETEAAVEQAEPVASSAEPEAPAVKPKRPRRKKADMVAETAETEAGTASPAPGIFIKSPVDEMAPALALASTEDEETSEDGQPRRGWWQRTFGA